MGEKGQLSSENGNSSRFSGTRRSSTSELLRTSRIRQRFCSTVDFINRSGQQLTSSVHNFVINVSGTQSSM